MRLFIDINVVLDVLAQREPWFDDSARLLAHIEQGSASGHIAAHTLTTLHDLLARHPGQQKTAAVLIDLTTLLRVEPVDNLVLQQALALGWRDFEDAVQAVTAAQCQADYLVTRNPRDFRQSLVPVVTPSEFLALRN
ncbi:MAG: PIN domain-containing protein [Thiobacillus sp.]|nr:PIN domain-containing protein [Thiobacillus sp.]MDP2979786.1 PIN domain-containing protein [Thiobacillus sp.]